MTLSQHPEAIRSRMRRAQQRYPIAPPEKDRLPLTIEDGVVLVGSDCHYWDGTPSTAHRAFVKMIKSLKPDAVILNGDVIDGARISRHASIGWERRPRLIDELNIAKERLDEIQAAGGDRHIWTLGNHCLRFETRLAAVAAEYQFIEGMHLKDHFPGWTPCWSVHINGNTVVKHRFRGGDNATLTNTIRSGMSIVTGHLHSLRVTPFSDYNGTRFGVDSGTLAEPYGPQFIDYTEDNPVSWRSGFIVLTYRDGRLMWPEVVHVIGDGIVEFRGEIIHV